MNNVVLQGRNVRELELKTTPSGKTVTEFTIAVQRTKDQADFILIQAWNKQAETLAQYVKKGMPITVIGSLRIDNYKDKDGNNKQKTYILLDKFEFVNFGNSNDKKTEHTEQEQLEEEDVIPF